MGQTEVLDALKKAAVDGPGWVDSVHIAHVTGINQRSVNRSLRRLVVYGFLSVRMTNIYTGKKEYRLLDKYIRRSER